MKPALFVGAIMASGTLIGAWAAVDVVLGGWALWLMATRRQWPPTWAWLLAGAITPGTLWSADTFLTTMTVVRVLGVSAVGAWILRADDRTGLAAGIFAGLAISTLHAAGELFLPGRAHGLNHNASELGQAGVIAWAAVSAAGWPRWAAYATVLISLPASMSRAPMAAVGLWAAGAHQRGPVLRAGGVLLLFMVVTSLSGGPGWMGERFEALSAMETRIQAMIGPDETTPEGAALIAMAAEAAPGESSRALHYSATGYGAGALWKATHRVRPHNWPQVAILELGILAVVPLGLAGWALWTRRIPGAVALGLLPLAILTDEMVATPGGHYGLALILLATRQRARRPSRRAAQPERQGSGSQLPAQLG